MTAFKPGDTLGRYRIERPLGQGAMGEVYLARDPQIGRPLALKTLRLVGVREEEVAERKARMLREARTAGRLIHPHIVTLFDAGEQDGLLFLAFEYVPGSDLAVRLAAGPLPVGEALRVVREACEGLAHAHREGIVHRDVKPSNLMLDAQGRVKISDFGIAKLGGEATELTVTGMVMGSPHYMSPEQIRGEELDGRSDLFSLGIVLYEALSGRRPFVGDTISTLVFQIVGSEPLPIVALRPGLEALPALLARLLAKDREARFPDAAAAGAEMARLEATLPAELLAAPAVGSSASTDATVVMPESGATGVPSAALPATSGASSGPSAAAPPGSAPVPPPPAGAAPAADSAVTPLPPTLSAPVTVPPPPPGPAAPAPATAAPGGAAASGAQGRSVAPPAADPGAGGASLAGGGSYAVPSLAGSSRRRILLAAAVLAFVAVAVVAGLALLKRTAGGDEVADAAAAGVEQDAPPDGAEPGAGDGGAMPPPASVAEPGPSAEVDPAQARGVEAGAAAARRSSSEPPPPTGRPPAAGASTGASAAAGHPGGAVAGSGSSSPATSAPGATPTGTPRPDSSTPDRSAAGSGASRDTAPPRSAPDAPTTTPPATRPEPRDDVSGDRDGTRGGDAFTGPVLDTGMTLAFEVRPPDAFVLVDGTVIGRAAEYGRAARRPFVLPSPGVHRITLRRDGMKDHELRVRASPGGPQLSPIRVRMEPLDATDTPLSELEMYRVREAVAFKVDPPSARLLVDGEPQGLANRWSGGRFRRDTWLELPLGIHRLSLIAPGRKRIDFAVDVTAGASEGRQRIEMVLPPLGAGGE